MFSVRPKFALFLVLVGLLAGTAFSSAQTSKTSHKRKSKPKPKVEQATPNPPLPPPPPPPPPTPEQLPSREPTVTYQNGELTILASNSTLGDILRAVGSKTGASIDVPPGANERVVSQFGPGPAREVLAKLLNGTKFNYVMIGTPTDPTTVAQLILTERKGGEQNPNEPVYQEASQPTSFTPPGIIRRGFNPQFPPNQVQNAPGDDTGGTMEEDSSADNDSNDNDAGEQPTPEQANAEGDQQANPNQPQVKTPEQLLQELQRQQQILQQQQEQQSQQPHPPQPYQPQIVHPVQPYPQTQPPQAQPPQQ